MQWRAIDGCESPVKLRSSECTQSQIWCAHGLTSAVHPPHPPIHPFIPVTCFHCYNPNHPNPHFLLLSQCAYLILTFLLFKLCYPSHSLQVFSILPHAFCPFHLLWKPLLELISTSATHFKDPYFWSALLLVPLVKLKAAFSAIYWPKCNCYQSLLVVFISGW